MSPHKESVPSTQLKLMGHAHGTGRLASRTHRTGTFRQASQRPSCRPPASRQVCPGLSQTAWSLLPAGGFPVSVENSSHVNSRLPWSIFLLESAMLSWEGIWKSHRRSLSLGSGRVQGSALPEKSLCALTGRTAVAWAQVKRPSNSSAQLSSEPRGWLADQARSSVDASISVRE